MTAVSDTNQPTPKGCKAAGTQNGPIQLGDKHAAGQHLPAGVPRGLALLAGSRALEGAGCHDRPLRVR
eukprot:6322991-Amphidinium_carterae.1